jgi:ATP-dependent exoDNAse (exonuclease V) beta subunit
MLTFTDVTNLLLPSEGFLGIVGKFLSDSDLCRLRLDERLDALYDHWLLDEFQDTSRNQYRVLENLLDEVISEAARSRGQRSFFCVGDIKQAIYGWRKGDARLFDEIHRRYSAQGVLARSILSSSWRSSSEILESLNAVFGDLSVTAPGLPERTRERWLKAWNRHQPAKATCLPGYVSLATVEGENDQIKKEDLHKRVISSLQEVNISLEQGMTIALLVRTTKEATEWIQVLRNAGIRALSESNPPVGKDSPVAAALRSALSLTAHPGDSFALGHLSMEPLGRIFFPGGNPILEVGNLISDSARHLAEGGFTGVTEWILRRLAPLIKDDFSMDRAASLRRAALKADGTGITRIDDFLLFLSDYAEQGRSAPHAVQVMTVHKAKGLEYDMVLLPLPSRQEALDSLSNAKIDVWENSLMRQIASERRMLLRNFAYGMSL